MGEAWLLAVGTVIAALIAAMTGAGWVNRKNNARLLARQADETDAKTTEITDRIARQWIEDLKEEVDELQTFKHEALTYIVSLIQWARRNTTDGSGPLPAIPESLARHIGGH